MAKEVKRAMLGKEYEMLQMNLYWTSLLCSEIGKGTDRYTPNWKHGKMITRNFNQVCDGTALGVEKIPSTTWKTYLGKIRVDQIFQG